MTPASFQHLLTTASEVIRITPELSAFCAVPDDLEPTEMTPHPIAAAELMARDTALRAAARSPLAQAILQAGPDAHWRETYKDTDIGARFLDRFGCYAIVGPNAAWTSPSMAMFMVYMPAGLWYPYHEHPAEEVYHVLAGGAEFLAQGQPARYARAGDTVFHASGQPHATETHDAPMLALVLWRNHLSTAPVLSQDPP